MVHAFATEADTQLPPHKDRTEHELPAPTHRPTSGRTTAQGRKVEKPRDCSPPGPSGQPDHTQHERRHTNK
jgi:hypothetical protein